MRLKLFLLALVAALAIPSMQSATMTWDFEDTDQLEWWSFVDLDGDGYNWYSIIGASNIYGHSGVGILTSASWASAVLHPDNWLVSPMTELGGSVSFWAWGQDPSYPGEVFALYVCPTGMPITAADFIQVGVDQTATSEMTEYTFDLSEYEGQFGCFAIRHYNVSDMFRLNIDDVTMEFNEGDLYPIPNPVIENLTADPDVTTADVAWDETDGMYNLRYRVYNPDAAEPMFWDFDTDESYEGWSIIDADGDGNTWFSYSGGAHSGNNFVMSLSYNGTAYDPDNWLISPEVNLNGTLTLWASSYSNSWKDNFGVFVTFGDPSDLSSYVQVGEDVAPPAAWTEYTFDLSEFAGAKATGHFAIRHYNSYNNYRLLIDDISIEPEGEAPAEWIYVNGLTDPEYTIEGLDPETTYEVQVQGYNFAHNSGWSDSEIFTTKAETTEQTAAPGIAATPQTKAYDVTITSQDPEAVLYYRVTYPDGTVSEWMEYEDVLSFTDYGVYTVEAKAKAPGKDESVVVSVTFEVTENTVPTGVNELINGKTVAGVRYFNMAGQEMQEANGMTIIVTTYTDGTTSAVKVVK